MSRSQFENKGQGHGMILRLEDKALPKGSMTLYEAKIMLIVLKNIQGF